LVEFEVKMKEQERGKAEPLFNRMVEQELKLRQLEILEAEGIDGNRFLVVPELKRNIPIYDFRNLAHQVEIARVLADGGQILMYGGVWGVFKGVKRATFGETFFERAKPGRPPEAKIPLLILPEDATKLVDWSQVHKDFRYLQDYWNFNKLWAGHGAFLHIIAPVRPTLESLPDIFKTTPEDFARRYPNLEPVPMATVALLSRYEPYTRHFGYLVKRFSHTDMYVGVSTRNKHGEEPPYTTPELYADIRTDPSGLEDIDLIATDRKYEESGAFASHTQIRMPLIGESPSFKVLRIGSLDPGVFKTLTGFECELIPGVRDVRKNPGEPLFGKLTAMLIEIHQNWQLETPQIHFRS